ncbi:MAG: hypothetical protein IJD78_06390 [Clostridia bacterium]|nr:hypothetical protein [Clostridia bacterium]
MRLKAGDTETAQRFVDEAAKGAGYEYKLYHQTGNDFTVFDTRHKGAGTGDSETPFGVFMKPSSNNIGLKGQKQMPVYAAIKNPLVVGDRDNLMHELKKDATVNAVQEEIKRVNADYKQRVDQAGKDLQSYLIEYRKKHPDEPRSEIYNDDGFNEIYEREDSLIDKWTASIDKLSVDSKNAITDYLKNQGYDGVILERDAGSFGRETKTYIALDNTQVKSADPVTYDDRGDVIPLSERFKESNVDIRYSMKQTDPIQAHYAEVMRENRNLKNIISALDDMQYSSARSNIHLNGRDIHNITGRLLKSASSKYELKAFEDELTAVYDYMANGRRG